MSPLDDPARAIQTILNPDVGNIRGGARNVNDGADADNFRTIPDRHANRAAPADAGKVIDRLAVQPCR